MPEFRRWTKLATECYQRKCQCKGCFHEKDCKTLEPLQNNQYKMRPMKFAVLKLYEKFGPPMESVL